MTKVLTYILVRMAYVGNPIHLAYFDSTVAKLQNASMDQCFKI